MPTVNTPSFGRYEITTELGRGAMGIVYRGFDPKINRVVAIKTISLASDDSADGEERRARFFREAEAAGRLSHPRIVAIFDIGESPETSSPYIVMEYIAGRSLEEILSSTGAGLPLGTTLQLIQEVAEGLDYAHLQGVVHRDVKPSNVIVGDDGHARIADFGIAQLNIRDGATPDTIWGTPGYMSPEQFRAEPVDGRSDLFSLGVILYRALTGHRPFQGNSALTVARKVQSQDPLPATVFNTQISPELDRVLARAIAKNPADRYQTGLEMVQDLQKVRDDLERKKDAVSPQASDSASPLLKSDDPSYNLVLRASASRRPAGVRKTAPPFPLDRPWQQAAIGLLTLGALALAFAGLWWATPVNAVVEIAFRPAPPSATMATIVALEQIAAQPRMEPPPAGKLHAREFRPVLTDSSHSCQLGIVVEHHFLTANISVWIDGETRYSHSLRGAIRKRVALFKGVNGYLSDVVELTPGEHQIRVQVLSADGSYDETSTISGAFTQGSEKLLTVGFDGHNRHMRLAFEAEKESMGSPKT